MLAQGGEIFAESEGVGKGTTVTFYLPLTPATGMKHAASASDAGGSYCGRSVGPGADSSFKAFGTVLDGTEAAADSVTVQVGSTGARASHDGMRAAAGASAAAAAQEAASGALSAPEHPLKRRFSADFGFGPRGAASNPPAAAAAADSARPPGGSMRGFARSVSGLLGGGGGGRPSAATPQATPATPPGGGAGGSSAAGGYLGRALAAEDDRASQLVLRKTLQRAGFDATVVGDGQQALDAWRDDPGGFDLCVH